jgi:hypothetical protein
MIRFGSGSYNLRSLEGTHHHHHPEQKIKPSVTNKETNGIGQLLDCSVFFLDDSTHKFQVAVSLNSFEPN